MQRLFRRGSRSSYQLVLVAGATAGMVIAGGLITARATSDVIHACRSKGSGIVRIVDAPGSCNGSETEMSWNAQGAAGRDGRDGVDGKDGKDGVDGGGGGATRIDQMAGQPCNVGSSNEGTLVVSYGPDGSEDPVTMTCRRNVQEVVVTARLFIASLYSSSFPAGTYGNAGGIITSEPAGLSCQIDGSPTPTSDYDPEPVTCFGDFLPGTEVVFNAAPDRPYSAWSVSFGTSCTRLSSASCKLTITENTLMNFSFRGAP